MAYPSASLGQVRPDLADSLTELDLAMERNGFIAYQVAPVFEASTQNGVFGKMTIEELLKERTAKRAPGAGYERGEREFTKDSFTTTEYGIEEVIDDREAQIYADWFDAELVAAEVARDDLLRAAEKRVADLIFNATTWTANTTGITNEWDDAANATPIADVKAARAAVYGATGIWPDTLIINRKVFNNLINVDEVVDRMKYQGFQDVRQGAITPAAMALAFDLRQILVAGSARNTAGEGATASLSPIWSDEYAMVCKVAETGNVREPCIARTFHWGADGSQVGGTIETYDEVQSRSEVVRARHDVQEKVIYMELGHLLSNITT